jgi:hypothetical protein
MVLHYLLGVQHMNELPRTGPAGRGRSSRGSRSRTSGTENNEVIARVPPGLSVIAYWSFQDDCGHVSS